MRLRTYPIVLRVHSSKRKEGHEKHYVDLMLFSHWRDEIKEFIDILQMIVELNMKAEKNVKSM